jgi:hypothetical protein
VEVARQLARALAERLRTATPQESAAPQSGSPRP